VRQNDAVTTTGGQTIEVVGLGWPTGPDDVSRETHADVSRETAVTTGEPVGLGWPG
jgi:hypothetical protein